MLALHENGLIKPIARPGLQYYVQCTLYSARASLCGFSRYFNYDVSRIYLGRYSRPASHLIFMGILSQCPPPSLPLYPPPSLRHFFCAVLDFIFLNGPNVFSPSLHYLCNCIYSRYALPFRCFLKFYFP